MAEMVWTQDEDLVALNPEHYRVSRDDACPGCGETRIDWLIWKDDEFVICQSCGACYDPMKGVTL